MLNSVALCAAALSFFIVTGSASGLGDIYLGLRSPSSRKVSSGYYPSWDAEILPLDKVSWCKYTSMTFAFVATTPSPDEVSIPDGEDILMKFVSAAKSNGVKALASIGGWGGSRYFSSNVGNAANRTRFVQTIQKFIQKYEVDGIDFDWEYPQKQGIGCNIISANDTSNFYYFLQELRHAVGEDFILTAAAPITPWSDPDGKPSNVTLFAEVLDLITIMNYDIWGSWSSEVGPNAPLNDTCAAPANQQGSAVSAIQAWTDAGIPNHKILLGVPAYGHSFLVNKSVALTGQGVLAAYPPFESEQPMGDSSDGPSVDVCGVYSSNSGIFNFWGLFNGTFLDDHGQPLPGIYYRYDNCSQTPYVYNQTSQVMVSYDDGTSFEAKGKFIADFGLKGHSIWQVTGDYNDILVDSIRRGGGY